MKMGTIFWLISTPRIDLTYGQSSLDRIPDNVYSTRVSFYPQLSEQEDGLTTSTSKIQHLRLRLVEQLRVCRAHCPSHPLRELLGRRANVEFCCLRVEVGLVGGDVIVVCSRLIVSGMAVMMSVMGVVIYVCHDFSSSSSSYVYPSGCVYGVDNEQTWAIGVQEMVEISYRDSGSERLKRPA